MNRIYRGGPQGGRGGPPGMQGRLSGGPLQRAQLALMNGQSVTAEEICRRELEKKPDDVMMRLVLAQALVQQQRAKEGVVEARRILEFQPKNVDALILLSSSLVRTNQINPPKEALEVAERAVQLQPKMARTHLQLAEVFMARREFDRARDEAETATQLEPRQAAAHLLKGLALVELKDYEGALQSTQNAIRFDRNLAEAHLGKARALTELHRADEAMAAIDEAEHMNPLLQPAQLTQLRAQVFTSQRKYLAAYRFLLRFIQRGGANRALAPVLAFTQLITAVFGQWGVAVILFLVIMILFGISRIPLVGGWIVTALLLGIVGYGAWNAMPIITGKPAKQLLGKPPSAAVGLGAGVVVLALVFTITTLIVGRGHHHVTFGDWFNPLSASIAGLLAIFGVIAGWRFVPIGKS